MRGSHQWIQVIVHTAATSRIREDDASQATDAEAKMWRLLRDRRLATLKFRRQVPFRNYMLDFVCFEKRLVVEIDGSQHAQSSTDPVRAQFLAEEGFKTLRYWNNDVFQRPTEVLEDILAKLVER